MDGSDDYFTDDIILDDQALAILDKEEQKYLTQAIQPPESRPPSKRQKTGQGWNIGIGSRSESSDDIEDLPEISLEDDGSYRVRVGTRNPLPALNVINRANSKYNTSHNKGPSHSTSSSALQLHLAEQHISSQTPSPNLPANSRIQPQYASHSKVPQNTTAINRQQNLLGKHPRSPLIPPITQQPQPEHDSGLGKQIEELQQRLHEMSEENAKIQAALKAAESAKVAKIGEVTVLRKSIEKTAQDHAAHIAKLKSVKEEADAKQILMQKEMREEMERMKTQFIFKQHELEASTRKPPLSVRPQKIFKEPPSTPMHLPSQIRGWNQEGTGTIPSMFMEETPTRSLFKNHPQLHPRKSPEKAKKPNALPGFQNAFATSTPLRPSQRRANKGKQRETGDMLFQSSFQVPPSPPSSPTHSQKIDNDIGIGDPMGILEDEGVTMGNHLRDPDGDIEMAGGEEVIIFEEGGEETYITKPWDWKLELNRIILTHIMPSFTNPTFHTILESSNIAELPLEMAEMYSATCARILEVIATTFKHEDFDKAEDYVSCSLIKMTLILSNAKSFLPLTALFNLLTTLVYALPNFRSVLLAQTSDSNSPQILVCIDEIIQNHLEGSKQYASKDRLARESVSLLEALCFNANDEVVHKLAFIINNPAALLTLLHASQPTWLLTCSIRLLMILATHGKLCRALVSIWDSDSPQVESISGPTRSPFVERLCYHLTETNCKNAEFYGFKASILTFFALLSHSQPEVHSALLGSPIFIPSLIVFLSHLTTPIWDDDEEFIASPADSIALVIRTLNQTLFLLHHLIFSTSPFFNLKHKLSSMHHIRHFNGLTHTFIVTFGRLCYADPPGWVNQQGRIDLVLLTDVAREILDIVVDGPECDNIWQAYQIESDKGSETDEEEMEAKLLGE